MPSATPTFIASDKPAGLTTHTSLNDADKVKPWVQKADGYLEWLESRLQAKANQTSNTKLFPVHRLDRETTGVLLFTTSAEAAELARKQFASRTVQKEYLFLTDRKSTADHFVTESFIERVGNAYVSETTQAPNSRTAMEKVREQGRYTLWIAKPETGKPHQIRLHAEAMKIPILGDSLHGGSEFPALCLHARSIAFPEGETYTSPPPVYFDDLFLLEDRRLVRWLSAIDRRERVLRTLESLSLQTSSETQTLRWIHTEGDPLRVEQLGTVTNLNWFADQLPNADEIESIHRLLKIQNRDTWYLQLRGDRGRDPNTDRALESSPAPPTTWTATENETTFEFRRDSGLSPGLFLDQRQNRAWLATQIKPTSKVLNLFCYTGGFSTVAAKSSAEKVVSVDVSKPFLDWAKRNFELNSLATDAHEFRAIDSGEYLAWAKKKSLKFDFIVCDPPSFARTNTRGKSSVFRIENEFDDLLKGCIEVTAPGARILFSTNFEQWTLDELAGKALALARKLKPSARVRSTPPPDLDFELPRAHRHMKSIIIEV